MRVAVTGGTGFIGSHSVRELRKHGDDVVVIARSVPADRHEPGIVLTPRKASV